MNLMLKYLILVGSDGNVGPNFPLPVRSALPRKRPLLKLSIWRIAAILRDSTIVVRTRPGAILLPMITTRKSIHGFPLVSYMGMGLRLATRAPLLHKILRFLLTIPKQMLHKVYSALGSMQALIWFYCLKKR